MFDEGFDVRAQVIVVDEHSPPPQLRRDSPIPVAAPMFYHDLLHR
jgi:hypothetical protein